VAQEQNIALNVHKMLHSKTINFIIFNVLVELNKIRKISLQLILILKTKKIFTIKNNRITLDKAVFMIVFIPKYHSIMINLLKFHIIIILNPRL
jgi:hypothetical protein